MIISLVTWTSGWLHWIHSTTKNQFKSSDNLRWSTFYHNQGGLKTNILDGLGTTKLSGLWTTVLGGLKTNILDGLGTTKLSGLGTIVLGGLKTTILGELKITILGGLKTTVLAWLRTTVLGGLKTTVLGGLATTILVGLRTTVLSELKTTILGGLWTTVLGELDRPATTLYYHTKQIQLKQRVQQRTLRHSSSNSIKMHSRRIKNSTAKNARRWYDNSPTYGTSACMISNCSVRNQSSSDSCMDMTSTAIDTTSDF